jgi:homoserine O-succinyltransferase
MPQPAFKATERQFISLLNVASGPIPIFLSLHVLPESEQLGKNGYSSIEDLYNRRFDGVIVTGRESHQPNLKDEAYWNSFTSLVDWAREYTRSSIWSCLAAHAAVLHIDGVKRRRYSEKYSGIFDCVCDSNHLLTAGAAPHYPVPHSRWHGVSAEDLIGHGYRMLVRTADSEPDTFVKQEDSLLVFLQGHPEYEVNTLIREYRRDVGRYVNGEAKSYPSIPRGCFSAATVEDLVSLQQRACSTSGTDALNELDALLEQALTANGWRANAALIYRNWLQFLWAKERDSEIAPQVSDPYAIQLAL